jgi:uncharacterized protein YjbI with pentapeptide repeats
LKSKLIGLLKENIKKQNILILTTIFFIIAILALWKIPEWEIASLPLKGEKTVEIEKRLERRIESGNSIRITPAQILVGFLLVGAYFIWRHVTAAEKTVPVSQEEQITERFTQAIDQLRSEKLEIRLDGIYTLERIARGSEKDHWQIMEILTTYIQENAPSKEAAGQTQIPQGFQAQRTEQQLSVRRSIKPEADIQAILTVIGRRKWRYKKGEDQRIDLRGTELHGVTLFGAHLEGAILARAHLEGARLFEAHLEEVDLSEAHLEEAVLIGAHLEKASLIGAHLEEACLAGAHLEGARLSNAHIEEAYLCEAHLEEAYLSNANLERVRGLTFEQLSKVKTLYKAKLDSSLMEQIQREYPHLLEEPKE